MGIGFATKSNQFRRAGHIMKIERKHIRGCFAANNTSLIFFAVLWLQHVLTVF